jgi:phosphoribosylanthranilate isomerase
MFKTKICGVTNVADARLVRDIGADAIGLNFYPQSPRYVERATAQEIVNSLGDRIVKVGLFVNASAEEVIDTYDRLGLDLIQLHGDEPPEFLFELGDRPVMRAFRVGSEGLDPVVNYLSRCRETNCLPVMVLLDAFQKDAYGGTGKTADWSALANRGDRLGDIPVVLAGGLTRENVAEAIDQVHPAAVDTASGVESAPGKKDPELVRQFVAAAKAAL